ncbi:hypothetical protein BKA70DRAFT_1094063 [Coprinopsis sp. MPI-PUGE-AT-0042]|nr:hypothetical protein BKA70DRAFT_1094063 [Coprinopsis sp. MPI-PUGE-AT-0042]
MLVDPEPLAFVDQSRPVGKGDVSVARSRRTTLEEMLKLSTLPLAQRPLVNALTLPMPPGLRPEQKFPFSTELFAWLRTLGNHFCFAPYPTSDMRWGLVAFNGALHYLHIDSDGFGTWIEVKTGLKLWVIARPKDGDVPSFTEIDGFLKCIGEGKAPNGEKWIIEAVVLAPGTRLIMAPNTLHAVWTMENSICHGGHFYSIATMLTTVVGLIHAFIGEADLTNTGHLPSRLLLRRMVHFFHHIFVTQEGSTLANLNDTNLEHLPNLEDSDLFVATFALLCFIELQNILDFRSYVEPDVNDTSSVWYGVARISLVLCDVNGIPHEERLECIYTRGLATELTNWIFSRYELVPQGRKSHRRQQDPWRDFYWPYLAHFICTIKAYKGRYPDGVLGSKGCTEDAIKLQVDRCVGKRPALERAIRRAARAKVESIVPPFPFSAILKRDEPLPFSREYLLLYQIV